MRGWHSFHAYWEGSNVSYCLILVFEFRIVGAMVLDLKVDIYLSGLPKETLSLAVFGSFSLGLLFTF